MAALEPIEKEDLDLKNKFVGKVESLKNNSPIESKEKELGKVEYAAEESKEDMVEKKEETYSKILSQATSYKPADTENLEEDAKIVSAEKEAAVKVAKLVGLAKEKGVIYAVKVARRSEDNYTLDEFHDRLAQELHSALAKEGLIKNI